MIKHTIHCTKTNQKYAKCVVKNQSVKNYDYISRIDEYHYVVDRQKSMIHFDE